MFVCFWLHWVFHCSTRPFSSCEQASPCGSPRAQVQPLWWAGLVTPRHVGSSWVRDRTRVPCRQIPNHWTTREAPDVLNRSLGHKEVFRLEPVGVTAWTKAPCLPHLQHPWTLASFRSFPRVAFPSKPPLVPWLQSQPTAQGASRPGSAACCPSQAVLTRHPCLAGFLVCQLCPCWS